ncbi:MAG: cyclic nucleotide-binding domain-containing protein [Anaerolineales bacterium]|nr:cyclic nucleotide-binding domain-containing protein [Anaerolineales bacterium]
MISIELLRRYPFFAGFTREQIDDLARVAEEESFMAGHRFINAGERLTDFYLVLEGTIGIIIEVPDMEFEQSLTRQITNNLITRDVTVSTVGKGEVFGWSALIPPNRSSANVKALTSCRVMRFDYQELQPIIDEDCCFGHLLTLKAAQIIRGRLQDKRVESLAELAI